MKRVLSIIAAMSALLLISCTETLDYAKEDKSVPVIESFSPATAPIGSVITVEGKYLNRVTVVKLGGVEVPIAERISNTRLTIIATSAGHNGKIEATNTYGTGTSETSFTYQYLAPTITELPASANMGDNMMISGGNLSIAEAVYFTADGYPAHQANIVSVNANGTEMVVRVPYVELDEAKISFGYFNGTSVTESAKSSAIAIVRNAPSVVTAYFPRTAVGRSFTITGQYLDKIDAVLVGGNAAGISAKTSASLTFTVPAGEFVDGDNAANIVISYFDGNETNEIAPSFTVYVPFVKFWEDIRLWGQGRDVEQFPSGAFVSFFSPETGVAYANADWRAIVDPVGYQYQATVCTAAQVINQAVVTEEMYNSVKPYFFFSGVSAGHLQINSPANSASQLRNFYTANNSAVDYRITGSSGDGYGTPALMFRYLDPGNATELAVINKVRNQTLEYIDEAEFPIDVTAKTVGGIGISSASGGMQSSVWAPGYVAGTANTLNVNSVLMVLYYNIDGPKASGGVADNIKRIGFIHIRTVNFRLYNNTTAPSSSDVLFNCYWQKHDYDYSKL